MKDASRPITPSLSSSGLVEPEDSSSTPSTPTTYNTPMKSEQRQDTCGRATKEAPYLVHQESPGAVCGAGGICDPAILADVLFPVFHRSGTVASPGSADIGQDSPHSTLHYCKGGLVTGAVLMDDPARISPDNCQKRGRFLVWPAVGGPPATAAARVLDSSSASS